MVFFFSGLELICAKADLEVWVASPADIGAKNEVFWEFEIFTDEGGLGRGHDPVCDGPAAVVLLGPIGDVFRPAHDGALRGDTEMDGVDMGAWNL